MKLRLVALSTGFAVALGGCTLNPIGEDPGINRNSNDNAMAGEGSPNDGVVGPEQDMSAPETVDPATGLPTPPAAGPVAGQPDPAAQPPEPGVISEPEGSPPAATGEPQPASEEPVIPPDAVIDGGVPFGDAGDAGDAAVPVGAR